MENQEARKLKNTKSIFLPSKIEICFYVSFTSFQPSTNIGAEKCQHCKDKKINKNQRCWWRKDYVAGMILSSLLKAQFMFFSSSRSRQDKNFFQRIQKVDELIVYTWMNVHHFKCLCLSNFGKHASKKVTLITCRVNNAPIICSLKTCSFCVHR